MTEQRLYVQGMTCASCQAHVERALRSVPGVASASVSLLANTADIHSTTPIDPAALLHAIHTAGYSAALERAPTPTSHEHAASTPERTLGVRALFALAAGALAMAVSMPLMSHSPAAADPFLRTWQHLTMPLMPTALMSLPQAPVRWTLLVLTLIVMLFAAPEIYTAAWRATQHRTTNMNTLVALGTLVAFAVSAAATVAPAWFTAHGLAPDVYFEAVILILAFLLAGRWLEARARARATESLRGFAALEAADVRWLGTADQPPTDLDTAPETILPLDAIAAGDLLRVLPSERIPADAVILHGRSSLDESMLTGEPLPITRSPGDHVTAGSLNLDGVLVLRATAVGADSTLAQMQRLLEQAQSGRAPMQRLADRASAIFVPTVLALAALTFAAWSALGNTRGHHLGFALPLLACISVLVVACPCAMGLAVPAAVTVAIGRAAHLGLLIKGGEALERLAAVDTLVLDKTGTLTEGKPHVTGIVLSPTAALPQAELLRYAASLERLSTHPLAAAIVAYANGQAPLAVEAPEVLPGLGVRGTIEGHAAAIGSRSFLNAEPPATDPTATPVHLALDGHWQLTFLIADTLRPEARTAIAQLHALGLRTLLVTGDTPVVAHQVAREAGIDDVHAAISPAGKLDIIRDLQRSGRSVAMAGDGINDAAALAQADAGLAMAGGTDLAREAGHVLLLAPDLRLLPLAIRIARASRTVMRQNLGWAVGYNLLTLPIAAGILYPSFGILLSPVLASAAMALSSVSVLLNSLRLRALSPAR